MGFLGFLFLFYVICGEVLSAKAPRHSPTLPGLVHEKPKKPKKPKKTKKPKTPKNTTDSLRFLRLLKEILYLYRKSHIYKGNLRFIKEIYSCKGNVIFLKKISCFQACMFKCWKPHENLRFFIYFECQGVLQTPRVRFVGWPEGGGQARPRPSSGPGPGPGPSPGPWTW